MNKRLVLLLTAIFLLGAVGIDFPAQAEVSGPFGYDLQKDIHRSKNKNNTTQKNSSNDAEKNKNNIKDTESQQAAPVFVEVNDDDIFTSSVNFNKVYYPNATMKSAIIKYKNGNYTGSLQELYTIVKREPENAFAYYYVAMAYTKVGVIESAKAAYQKVINLNPNEVLVDYAVKGQNCLAGNVNCTAADVLQTANEDVDELDIFIASPYGNGLSSEMDKQYRQQQLNAIQNKINSGQSLNPSDIQKMKKLQNKSEILSGEKLAMADDNFSSVPSNEEVLDALDVLKRAGLNISTQGTTENISGSSAFTPDSQIREMSMLLGNGSNTNSDPMMTMLPYMMEGEGKNVDPQVIQAMMMNSMMNSINGMNNTNLNN